MFEDYKQAGTAEWDQRQAYHKRLHETILLCHNSNITEDYNTWFKALNILYLELVSHIDDKLEEAHEVKKSMKRLKHLYHQRNGLGKTDNILELFITVQEKLHQIMRAKEFDVPIKKRREGSIIENEGSY